MDVDMYTKSNQSNRDLLVRLKSVRESIEFRPTKRESFQKSK